MTVELNLDTCKKITLKDGRKALVPVNQEGWVTEKSGKRLGHYYIYVEDPAVGGGWKRTHASLVVASKSDTTKRAARQLLRDHLAQILKKGPRSLGANLTFAEFTNQVFVPLREGNWKPATRRSNHYTLQTYLIGRFGDERLDTLDPVELAKWLLEFSGTHPGTIQRVFTMLRAITRTAFDLGYIPDNPAKTLKQPKVPKRKKPIMSPEQLRLLFNNLESAEDKCIFSVGALGALRSAEAFGLCWSAWEGDCLRISSTAYLRELYRDSTKTEASAAAIPLAEVVRPWLEAWHALCPDTAPDALMFSVAGTKGRFKGKRIPWTAHQWWNKRVWPVAERIGIPRDLLKFQVTRRSVATLMLSLKCGTVKDIQDFLRHAEPATTLRYYVQPVDESTRAAVNNWAEVLVPGSLPSSGPELVWDSGKAAPEQLKGEPVTSTSNCCEDPAPGFAGGEFDKAS